MSSKRADFESVAICPPFNWLITALLDWFPPRDLPDWFPIRYLDWLISSLRTLIDWFPLFGPWLTDFLSKNPDWLISSLRALIDLLSLRALIDWYPLRNLDWLISSLGPDWLIVLCCREPEAGCEADLPLAKPWKQRFSFRQPRKQQIGDVEVRMELGKTIFNSMIVQ